jgi:AcrR family transcriptional regulator
LARTAGSSGAKTLAAIRRAGLRLIHVHGYEAMSLRQLAAEVGIQQGSLYNHIRTKQDLLFDLIAVHMQDLLQAADAALQAGGLPLARLKAFVAFHVDYHIERKLEVMISYSELRSLEPENFKAVVALRSAYERKLIAILQDGAADGSFALADPRIAAFGILSMLSGIATWFDPRGRLPKAAIAEIFADMVVGAVTPRQRAVGLAPPPGHDSPQNP